MTLIKQWYDKDSFLLLTCFPLTGIRVYFRWEFFIPFLGNTPLHKTCEFANEDTIKTLIENGADTDAVNNDGETPTDKCCLQCLIGDCFQKCKFVHGK